MRKKQIELSDLSLDDIGFIGGGRPWTEEDSKAISAFLQGGHRAEQIAEKKYKSLKKSIRAVNKLKKAS
jgi:hypothetical protein